MDVANSFPDEQSPQFLEECSFVDSRTTNTNVMNMNFEVYEGPGICLLAVAWQGRFCY